ncbi:hypothetical protein [Microbacterium sp. AG238]|uniref:hypothetical protein n=1 Tax=Microbacterium sp. AG238 TaxID=2183994 RepID=UPI000E765D4C|nr:hypothetical protein [Microbacterium sp. AG238]RKE64917.1 hypothetical protein DEU36_2153 [Microbacterium sp. AG238]
MADVDPTGMTAFARWRASARLEWRIYFAHVVALVSPGHVVPSFPVHQIEVGKQSGWNDGDHDLLIEQGRAQLARQRQELENVRARAQFLFTTTLGVFTLALAALPHIIPNLVAFLIWALSLGLALLCLLGAAGIVVARKDLTDVDAALVSQQDSPVRWAVSKAYAMSVGTGEETVATQITILRNAVAVLIVACLLLGVGWLVAIG